MRALAGELWMFGLKEARCCLFPALFFAALALSNVLPLGGLARYDAIFLAAVAIQAGLVLAGIETPRELAALAMFHLLGLALELFKTHPAIGSWSYPEPGMFKLGAVPLYSGFMYAAVASYMCQAWRILRLDLRRMPPAWLSAPLGAAIYLNFFTHHFFTDLRWWLMAGVALVFWRAEVRFLPAERERRMPLPLAFGLIGFFIWLAEQIATLLGAWRYPHQRDAWRWVGIDKISSWALLAIVSFLLVAELKRRYPPRRRQDLGAKAGARIVPAAPGAKAPPG